MRSSSGGGVSVFRHELYHHPSSEMTRYIGRLVISPLEMICGRRWYRLEEAFGFSSSRLGRSIHVPAGFVTDMASIPRWIQPFLQKDEGCLEAAVIHDYAYSADCPHGLTRKQADELFLEAMTEAGVGPVKRGLMYHAVRKFGARSWRKR